MQDIDVYIFKSFNVLQGVHLIYSTIQKILGQHCPNVDVSVDVTEILNALPDNNTVLKHTQASAPCQPSYTARELPLEKPAEFLMSTDKQSTVYVPVLRTLQALLNKEDILEKALSSEIAQANVYQSYEDGLRFKKSTLLTEEEFRIALSLYIHDFEVANPSGTSKKKQKFARSIGFLPMCPLNIVLPFM